MLSHKFQHGTDLNYGTARLNYTAFNYQFFPYKVHTSKSLLSVHTLNTRPIDHT